MSIEAFTWVMGIVFGWALHATLVHERIGHVVLAMTAIAVAAHRLEMDAAGTVSAATVFLIGGISFLVMAVASRLWAEAIEAYWRNQGGSLGSTLAGWEPFFAWRPVYVDSQWHWLSVLERRRASVRPAGGTWVYRRIGM